MKLINKKRILVFTGLRPIKKGSFEDFVCHLAKRAESEDFSIHFVFDQEISKEVKHHFDSNRVSYELVSMDGLSFYKNLLKSIVKHKPHLIHFHFIGFNWSNVWLCRLLGVRHLVFTDHDSHPYVPAHPLIEKLRRAKRSAFFMGVDKVIAVSGYVEKRLVDSVKVPQKKVVKIYNSVDLNRFKPSDESRIMKKQIFGDDNRKVVVCIAQLIPEKGIHILLKAAANVLKYNENVLFAIVGEGSSRTELEDLVHEEGIQDSVRFLGLRSDTESILVGADVLACPSIWEEAFGLCNAEAMACGLPVVASKTGGIPEIVRDGITGFLVEPGDHSLLAEAIETILGNHELACALGKNGRKRAQNLFNVGFMASNHMELYRDLCRK